MQLYKGTRALSVTMEKYENSMDSELQQYHIKYNTSSHLTHSLLGSQGSHIIVFKHVLLGLQKQLTVVLLIPGL
jgi:hypothetical protein